MPKVFKSEKERRKARLESIRKSRKKLSKCINVRFYYKRDKAILEHLEKIENKTDYLRRLINADISINQEKK